MAPSEISGWGVQGAKSSLWCSFERAVHLCKRDEGISEESLVEKGCMHSAFPGLVVGENRISGGQGWKVTGC